MRNRPESRRDCRKARRASPDAKSPKRVGGVFPQRWLHGLLAKQKVCCLPRLTGTSRALYSLTTDKFK